MKDLDDISGNYPKEETSTHLDGAVENSMSEIKNGERRHLISKMAKNFTEEDKEELDRKIREMIASEKFKKGKEKFQKFPAGVRNNLETCPVLQHESQEKRTKTQIRSFTKWVNKQLEKGKFSSISAVTRDFSDGKSLLNLISVLFAREIRRNHGELTTFKIRDNIAHAIEIIESYNIDLVNIDADEIINRNIKLTLGLTWSLILRSIATFTDNTDSNFKAVLLNWCKECTKDYDNAKIEDFSTSWKNGLAFNAILHHFSPSFDYKSLSPSNDHHNLKHAFDLAEKKYKIAPLLDVTDLTDNILPDEKSIITYLSDYYLKLECLNFKSHLEKGKQCISSANRKICEDITSYDKLYHQIYTSLREKESLQKEISELIEKHRKIDNLDDNLMKLSSLYGDLQTAFPIFCSKEFITENSLDKLLEMHLKTLIIYKIIIYYEQVSSKHPDPCFNLIKTELNELKDHLDILSTKVRYEEHKTDYSTQETSELFHNCLNILKKKEAGATKPVAGLYSEKIKFLTLLAQHKKYSNYRLNTAIRLFQTYDTTQKGCISTSDMKNCCAVLDISLPKDMGNIVDAVAREAEEFELTFDYTEYINHVKAEFAKQEKKYLQLVEENVQIHNNVQ